MTVNSPKKSSETENDERMFFKSVFDKVDKHKSGDIQLAEMIEILENEGEIQRKTTKKVFLAVDKNRDNSLDFDAFEDMIKNETYGEVFSRYVNSYVHYFVPRRNRDVVDPIYEDKYSCRPPPIALFIISVIELICFMMHDKLDTNGPVYRVFIYNPYRRYEAWRYLTYMFVHIGYAHLTVNLIIQLLLGFPLEMVHKGWRVLLVYFSGVIAGALGTSIVHPETYLAGSSCGVYALVTAHIGTISMNWNEMAFPGIQLGIFLLIIGLEVGTSVYSKYFLDDPPNMSYVSHICGAIAGLLVGIWHLKNFKPSRKENLICWCALAIYITFMGTMILLNIVWIDHFLPSKF